MIKLERKLAERNQQNKTKKQEKQKNVRTISSWLRIQISATQIGVQVHKLSSRKLSMIMVEEIHQLT